MSTAAENEETQSVYEDGGAGGPGAPTPLSALEVAYASSYNVYVETLIRVCLGIVWPFSS